MKYKLVRQSAGRYITKDGLFTIWQSCSDRDYEILWNVSHRDFDESLTTTGFRTKRRAVEWLKNQYEALPDCYFADYRPCFKRSKSKKRKLPTRTRTGENHAAADQRKRE